MPVQPFKLEHTDSIAKIHAEALEGDFLPSMGVGFLETYYESVLSAGSVFGYVYFELDIPVGFVAGSTNAAAMFRNTISGAAIKLGWKAIPALLRHPHLLRNVVETFLYPEREAVVSDKAELVVIAVCAEKQGEGIGRVLVEALNREFRKQKVTSYKVSVLESRVGANGFYKRLGFQQAATFSLYGKGWIIYTYDLVGSAL